VCRADLVNSAEIASNVKGAGVFSRICAPCPVDAIVVEVYPKAVAKSAGIRKKSWCFAHPAIRRQRIDAQNVGTCVLHVWTAWLVRNISNAQTVST
jgi:hypothetical protein